MLVFRGGTFFPCEKTCKNDPPGASWDESNSSKKLPEVEKDQLATANSLGFFHLFAMNKKSDSPPKKKQNNTHPKDATTTPKAGGKPS